MSILIKRIDSASGGGSSKGYPPGNINIIKKAGLNTKVYLRWSDPDNVTIGSQTLSTWNSTVIVRKEESAPKSPTDGTVVITNTTKNKYKDTDLVDSGLTNGKTYYYRFFTVNTKNLCNSSSDMIFEIPVIEANSVLQNNSWDTINKVSEAGYAQYIWNIGDSKYIQISRESNSYTDISPETLTLQIWDFNHFDKSDGSGKAGICFGTRNLMEGNQRLIYMSDTSAGGNWNDTDLKNSTIPLIISGMEKDLQNVLKEVNTYANRGDYSSGYDTGLLSKDKVFIPGHTEVYGDTSDGYGIDQSITESNQKQFPIFADSDYRKKIQSGSNTYRSWWLRSPHYETAYFCYVRAEYDRYTNVHFDNRTIWNGICLCFNV